MHQNVELNSLMKTQVTIEDTFNNDNSIWKYYFLLVKFLNCKNETCARLKKKSTNGLTV